MRMTLENALATAVAPARATPLPATKEEQIIELHRRGLSVQQIADSIGCRFHDCGIGDADGNKLVSGDAKQVAYVSRILAESGLL